MDEEARIAVSDFDRAVGADSATLARVLEEVIRFYTAWGRWPTVSELRQALYGTAA